MLGPQPTLLPPGTNIGRFQVTGQIAVGGMAEVYRARASGVGGFERQVVLKRLLPELARHDGFVRMFLDEARLGARLHHPNVAQVLDVGFDGPIPYLAMEYVDGRSLLAIGEAAAGALPLECALAIVVGAAAGLHHAHELRDPAGAPLGVVHRDVSPGNVLVTFDGTVKVTDFGIARSDVRSVRTGSGVIRGTTAYMSPEQVRGRGLDRRSDIFSLGILLYELTTGSLLFDHASQYDSLHRIATVDIPRPSTRCRKYPRELERIVLRALRPEREARWQTMLELQQALEELGRARRLLLSPRVLGAYVRELCPRGTEGAEASARASATPARPGVPHVIGGAQAVTAPLRAGAARPRPRVRPALTVALATVVLGAGLLELAQWGASPSRAGTPGGVALSTAAGPAEPGAVPPAPEAATPPPGAPAASTRPTTEPASAPSAGAVTVGDAGRPARERAGARRGAHSRRQRRELQRRR